MIAPAELLELTDDELESRYLAELALLGLHDEAEIRRALDEEPADLIEELSRIEAEFPLAAAVLWVKDSEPYDQRRLVASLVHPLTLVLGGNRSGKTYAILEALVAFALGRDHPATQAWLTDNDLPPELIPLGPGECYAVASSAAASLKIHRRDIDALLPRHRHWRGMNAAGEASVEITVPGYEQPAVIWFKSIDQGHRAFKGDQVRFVAISEEPEGDEGRLVLDECMRACAATGGRVVLEMTPQLGFTWTYDDLFVDRKYDCRLIDLGDSLNNYMVADHASLVRWVSSLSEEEQSMRRFGRFTERKGLVYPAWSRGTGERFGLGHVCEPFEIPEDWPRVRVHDWGQTERNGTACLWIAIGDNDTRYVYREYYLPGEPSFKVHARNLRLAEPKAERITASVADHEDEAIAACHAAGLSRIELADKDVEGGISRCSSSMLVVGNRPRFKVFSTCRDFIREIESYRRDPNKRDGAPIKRNDHLMDCWRYAENLLASYDERRRKSDAYARAVGGVVKRRGR